MVFLIVVSALLMLNIVAAITLAHEGKKFAAFFHYIAVLAGTLAGLLGVGLLNQGHAVQVGAVNWSVHAYLAFALISGVAFTALGRQNWMASKQAAVSGWKVGLVVWGVAGSLYIVGTVVDHWWFFRDTSIAGVANAKLLGVEDVKCDGMVLVRMVPDAAEFRCPELLIYGPWSATPFLPWPTYESGVSSTLTAAIKATEANAEYINP